MSKRIEVEKQEPNHKRVCDICDYKVMEYSLTVFDGADKILNETALCDDCWTEFVEGCELISEE